ncbi:MAG: hypothetical protein HZC40_05800 [Chloroflexi bacterium]|nr:hypothetical protein [Chloroflexota bacterium]
MFNLELSPRQAAVLHKILQSYHSDLQLEISDMDIEGLSEVLIAEENAVNQILAELDAAGFALTMETGEYAG